MEPKCSCKGVRTCLACEQVKEPSKHAISKRKVRHPFTFCTDCRLCWPGWIDGSSGNESTESTRDMPPLNVPGIEVYEDFLTREEESNLVDGIDSHEWDRFAVWSPQAGLRSPGKLQEEKGQDR
ncbi:hypothetical protein MTO96_031570 [Rhipicephalus appendiculatus]